MTTMDSNSELTEFIEKVSAQSDRKIETIVCYGLGRISTSHAAAVQFSFLLKLRRRLNVVCEIFDPVFSKSDKAVLEKYDFRILDRNECAKRRVEGLTLFYMPHCDLFLYNNLLYANWGTRIGSVMLIGNSLISVLADKSSSELNRKYKYVSLCEQMIREIPFPQLPEYRSVFNNISLMTFHASERDSFNFNEEPVYSDLDMES